MNRDLVRLLTPEERELERKRAELAVLESRLAERELELATLQAELKVFEQRYLAIVGVRYAELDEIEAQIAELLARRSSADAGAWQRAEQARSRAQDSADATGGARESPPPPAFIAGAGLRSLYRQVAKAVHPDLAGGPEERARRETLMAQANLAYERGDEAALRTILQNWELRPESVKGDGIGAELIRVIRKMNAVAERLESIDAELTKLKGLDLYQLKMKVAEAETDGRDLLAEMVVQLETQIADARARLQQLSKEQAVP